MKTKYVIYREGWLQSLICDLQTMVIMCTGFVLNEWYVHSDELAYLMLVTIVFWLLFWGSDKGNTFHNIDDVVAYLEKDNDE